MKGVAHYKKDGTIHKGGTHKMPNGELHTGKTHNSNSEKLFHFDELSDAAKKVAKKKVAKKKVTKKERDSFVARVNKRMK